MSLLGQDSITITDITDVNPIRLDLASSQPIYQTKRASGYEPDYKTSPLIITPALYFGVVKAEEEDYRDKIEFRINGVKVTSVKDTDDIYVQDSVLYIKQNLTCNTKIEAIIEDITDKKTNVTYEHIETSLSFYLLSYETSGFTAFISSYDGRYDFSSENSGKIKLIAHLYSGSTELTPEYEWKRSSGLIIPESKKNQSFLEVGRTDIYSHENFICEMKYDEITYIATCAVDDRTDEYIGVIVSDKSLVMSPTFATATFTCQILKNGKEININEIEEETNTDNSEEVNTDSNGEETNTDSVKQFSYSWILYSNGSTDNKGMKIGGDTKSITITLGQENIPKDSFTLYCTTTIDGKNIVVSHLSITYKNGGYTAFIKSDGGRYDFSSENSGKIKLIACLYDGDTELTPDYEWKRSSNPDATVGNEKSIDITRDAIYSHENFICNMEYEGITYTAVCPIDDRTDEYTGTIVSSGSLVMSPSFDTATFTCQILKNGNVIEANKSFTYSWTLFNGETVVNLSGKTGASISLKIGEENVPRNSFTLYCTTEIDNKNTVVSYLPITYKNGGYTALINSEGGRYDFSSDKSAPITLTAHLYDGIKELTPDYSWERSSGLAITKPTNKQDLRIERADIHSHENFVCKMKYEGVTYTATCAIDDRTDLYTSTIISNAPLVMTPKFNTATLACKIFRNGEEVKAGNINYSWILYKNDSSIIELSNGENNTLDIELGQNNIPKDNFSIYCTAVIDKKYTTVSYISISYSEPYTPILIPKTIFIPANNDGSYRGSEDTITKNFSFFLQGDNGAPLEVTEETLSINSIEGVTIISKELCKDENDDNKNKYAITFSISVDNFNALKESSMFELSYTYKNQTFNEEFYIVKSMQGERGSNGSSYSLILSNDYHRFAGKEVYADEEQEVSTNIRFFKGDDELKIKSLKINSKDLNTSEQNLVLGLMTKINTTLPAKNVEITFKTIPRTLKEGGKINIEAIVTINGIDNSFITTFTYDINYEGNAYFLSFINGTSISYLPSKNTFKPNKLEFYAYYRRNGLGENKIYPDGRVYVSIDGSEEKEYLPPKVTGGAYYEYTKVSNIKNSITFYLYNSLTKTEGLKDEYLMDRETIPILTSLEGKEIGGDNLLRFTRTLQEWDIQNSNKDTISINKDIDTNYATFKFNASTGDISDNNKVCILVSPEIYIGKELENKTFCFSTYFKNDSENYFDNPPFTDGNIHASIYVYNKDTLLDSKEILCISNTNLNNVRVENDEPFRKGKWVRVYQTFSLDTFSNNILTNATHYIIKIIGVISKDSNFTYNFSIKKPKLEIGNTLTSWSVASNDILFENLNVNLENLDSHSLVEVLNNQIANLNVANGNISSITNNMATGNISFSIETAEGTKRFTNLEDFSNYLNSNINQIIYNTNDKYALINNTVNALISDNKNFFELKNNIELGFDDTNKFEPYLLFKVVGGQNKDKIKTMRLTTKKLSFYSGENELAYFGSNSMTIKRARVSEGYYLGSDATGYLVMKTTPQGCAFVWQSTKFEQ